jgi:hypothetical protein
MRRVLKSGGRGLIIDLRWDASMADIAKYGDGLEVSFPNLLLMKLVFRYMLLPRAWKTDAFAEMLTKIPFRHTESSPTPLVWKSGLTPDRIAPTKGEGDAQKARRRSDRLASTLTTLWRPGGFAPSAAVASLDAELMNRMSRLLLGSYLTQRTGPLFQAHKSSSSHDGLPIDYVEGRPVVSPVDIVYSQPSGVHNPPAQSREPRAEISVRSNVWSDLWQVWKASLLSRGFRGPPSSSSRRSSLSKS